MLSNYEIIKGKMEAMTRNSRLYHYLVNIFIREGLRLTCNEEDFKQEVHDFMEDVYKGHKWDFSEWQSRLATKTSHPDDNSDWLRKVETNYFHEQFALNRKLVYQVYICERQLRERLSRGLKIGYCPVTEIYYSFPQLLSQQTEKFQPLTALCDHISRHYDLNFDPECRRVHWLLSLETEGVDLATLPQTKEAPLAYIPEKPSGGSSNSLPWWYQNPRPGFHRISVRPWQILMASCQITT